MTQINCIPNKSKERKIFMKIKLKKNLSECSTCEEVLLYISKQKPSISYDSERYKLNMEACEVLLTTIGGKKAKKLAVKIYCSSMTIPHIFTGQ